MTGTAVVKADAGDAMPASYADAVRALIRCQNIDEAKEFSDAADALAVWARIYKQNEAGRQAKQLRLHAFRRMGLLARELAPAKGRAGGGSQPGPVALLRKHGITRHQADAANHLAKITLGEFEQFVDQERPPAPTSVVRRFRRLDNLTPWRMLRERPRTPFSCAGYISNNDARELAQKLTPDERKVAAKMARNLIRWLRVFLDEIDQGDNGYAD